MADLTDALAHLLAPWSLHHLLTDWDGYLGWRHNTCAGYAGGDPWLSVQTSHAGLDWHGHGEAVRSATWPDVRQLLDRIPDHLTAQLAAAYEAYRVRPRGVDRTDGQIATAGYATRELDAAAAACWVVTHPADVQLDLFPELVPS